MTNNYFESGDAEERNFQNFISNYLQDILKFHGAVFFTYNAALQQQIQHLSFVVQAVCDSGLVENVLQEHSVVENDLECGLITWENVHYFTEWRANLLKKLEIFKCNVYEDTELMKKESDTDKPSYTDVDNPIVIQISKKRKVVKKGKVKTIRKKYLPKKRTIFITHYTKDEETGICECNYCGKHLLFKDYKKIKNHMLSKHPDKFKDSELFNSLKDPATGERIMEGADEQAVFKEEEQELFICDCCADFKTVNKRILERHKFEKHEQTLCSECGMNFSKFEDLLNHSLTHISTVPKCQECGKVFGTEHTLKKHIIREHRNQKVEVCPHCGKTFSHRYGLQSHLKKFHDNSAGIMHPCEKCGSKFRSRSDLMQHFKIHEEAILFTCPYCNKSVKQLEGHLQKNCSKIPGKVREKFVCELCHKNFHKKEALTRHIKTIHEKIKDYHCLQCDYKTYSNCNLYVHVKRMHEGRSYKEQCPHCPKIVVNLEFHIKTYHGHIVS